MNNYQPHHVAFTVRDLNEAIEWYKVAFGFNVTHSHKSKDGDMQIALLKVADDFNLELFHFSSSTENIPEYRKELVTDLKTIGTKHLCLQVEDLDAEIKHLGENGVSFSGKKDSAFFGGNYIFLRDPSGNLIELCEIK